MCAGAELVPKGRRVRLSNVQKGSTGCIIAWGVSDYKCSIEIKSMASTCRWNSVVLVCLVGDERNYIYQLR